MKTNNNDTGRRNSFGGILNSIGSLLRGLSCLLVVLLIFGLLGRAIIFRNPPAPPEFPRPERELPVQPATDWSGVDRDMAEAVASAREAARVHADRELGEWIESLKKRVDERFLDWHFGYWTQKEMGFKAIWYRAKKTRLYERFLGEQPAVAEQITRDIRHEFEQRVLRPVIAQYEIERIAASTVGAYVADLDRRAGLIRARYDVPAPDWNSYLSDLALVSASSRPDTVPVTMKAFSATAVAGSAIAADRLAAVSRQIWQKYLAKKAAAGAGKTAAAAAGKTGAKLSGKVLPLLLPAVVIWDVWDHHRSRRVNEAILRENLDDYFGLLRESLLDDPETGILSVIAEIESSLRRSLAEKPGRPGEAG